jgi:hypothetical protein
MGEHLTILQVNELVKRYPDNYYAELSNKFDVTEVNKKKTIACLFYIIIIK